MRVVFDENTPKAVAHAIGILVAADTIGSPILIEVLHATEVVPTGAVDTTLIEAIASGTHAVSVLITSDKAMRTRHHERAAFAATGCIGIVLRGHWNHASLWDRARLSLTWWTSWIASAASAKPGSLLECPWSGRAKPLKPY